jgi:protein-tyrosine phosphatase
MAQAKRALWDTHSHVLPDFDDGPEAIEEALEMVRLSAERGVTGIVATPHSISVDHLGDIAELNDRVGRLKSRIIEYNVPVELVVGMEIRLFPDTAARLTAGTYVPLNGTRIPLIEFDYTRWAEFYDDALFNVALAGFTPLLAHVERIEPLQQHPERVTAYVERGYYTQITSNSVLGGMGRIPPTTRRALPRSRRDPRHRVGHPRHRWHPPTVASRHRRTAHIVGGRRGRANVDLRQPRPRRGRAVPARSRPRTDEASTLLVFLAAV